MSQFGSAIESAFGRFFAGVSHQERLFFTKHLSILLKSGIILTEALQILVEQTKSDAFRIVLKSILRDIENGQSLSNALKKQPRVFDQLYVSLVEVGEESGTLEKSLEYLALKLNKDYTLQRKVQGALLYPAIVFVAALFMGGYLSLFVLPQLTTFFSGLDVNLPLATKILVWFADLMKFHGVVIIVGTLGLLLLLRVLIELKQVKPYWHAILLSIPLFGPLLQNAQLILFCRNIGVMLQSGLPITGALDVEYRATSNLVFKNYIAKIRNSVNKGKGISSEITSGHFHYFPLIATKMIAVGEKTGKLDESLLYLGDFFEEEVDEVVKNISVIIEPILLLCLGLVVGFIGIAIITPIYQLSGSIKR